jgi:hypothetical protein
MVAERDGSSAKQLRDARAVHEIWVRETWKRSSRLAAKQDFKKKGKRSPSVVEAQQCVLPLCACSVLMGADYSCSSNAILDRWEAYYVHFEADPGWNEVFLCCYKFTGEF